MLRRLAPLVFVVLWSTGFIGSRLGASDAEPFTFLSIRFVLALGVLVPIAAALCHQARGWHERAHGMVVGALIHGACLGGVFWAIGHATSLTGPLPLLGVGGQGSGVMLGWLPKERSDQRQRRLA